MRHPFRNKKCMPFFWTAKAGCISRMDASDENRLFTYQGGAFLPGSLDNILIQRQG